ncbi:hypothetical protein [Blastococcus saxobsidens]|uniref:AbiJ-NTD3 domain-containing protein n=1 Tax=Blastococcus saxobsidens (strain DD2) TaxID=1146883 RepID=H6RKL6_BLASD|nr:hypothetical protein [Blastococcus saxobsidens]CCG02435.1 conserved protein of unknown function [Blastococcus saxobsidens DD2]
MPDSFVGAGLATEMPAEPTAVDSKARDLARELVSSLHGLRHVDLDTAGASLGLDIPGQQPDPSPVGEDVTPLSKQQRLDRAFDAISPSDYEAVCARFLQQGNLSIELRNRVEDLLWSRENWPPITARVRRELAEALDASGAIWSEADGLLNVVKRHWVLHPPAWSFDWKDPYEPVARHMIWNPDWTTIEFFKEVGALDGGDRRFALFLEGLLSGSVNPNEPRQRALVAAISPVLTRAGLKIVESGTTDGYPDFTIVGAGTRPRPAQLILFASPHAKPALRIRDVLDQSIEVLTGDDTVLAYDVPVGERGLTWRDVESWWSRRRDIPAAQAKRELWQRLANVCADVSPAQRALFGAYYDYAKGHDPLFALLPEVWLHWDPVSRAQRGEDAYLNQRMDFLMLLPGLRRVALEVDGQQHYATSAGEPSPRIYSVTTRGDRDLRLSGYEVYRFSGYELTEDRASDTVREFFDRLLHWA